MKAHENPFRTSRLAGLEFRHPGFGNAELFERLRAKGLLGSIVGPHGSGKTTLLRDVARRIEALGMRGFRWFLNEETQKPSVARLVREARALGPRDVLLFDGAGHLDRFSWLCLRRAAARAGGFVVTAHAPGRLPTWVETSVDHRLAHALTRELVGELPLAGQALLERLCEEHRGNLHEVFLALYDRAAGGERIEPR